MSVSSVSSAPPQQYAPPQPPPKSSDQDGDNDAGREAAEASTPPGVGDIVDTKV